MTIAELITRDRIRLEPECSSQKRSLETLAELLAVGGEESAGPASGAIFEALSAREKLGSTGLGHGVAIPHGRLAEIDAPRVAVLRLDQGVDFDAMDHEPVDILIALLVPEAATSEHLDLLAQLARGLSQPDNIASLRRAGDADALERALTRAFGDA
ncbi:MULTISPECIES: PTS sugar transporter subunit IIA [unclassified Thioalkalivibrio]|uniref:PTS sugar transporter subunit IIA n=1 Tax=unclassified Thioalkalivibrio TaxID=2621013 RepID=UPI00036B27FE|nr:MULTISPECIES: PTS sugar transporter subunit IIA [unclassified Thioalkalivibrio]